MINPSTFSQSVLSATLALAACDQRCPAGFELFDNTCVLAAGGAAGSSSLSAGQPSELQNSSSAAGAAACADNTFGQSCMSASDCGCDTDYCAGYPGQPGICTHTDCLSKPETCPAQWACLDLSTIQAGLPSICSPPQ